MKYSRAHACAQSRGSGWRTMLAGDAQGNLSPMNNRAGDARAAEQDAGPR
ncbi:MAG TPA: hypothetical protein VGJ51_17915 [Candidatus Angelobacter sp.]